MTYTYDPTPARGEKLAEAHRMGMEWLETAERRGLLRAGVSELQLTRELQALGREMFGPFKHWHKRIVRAGTNTLSTYGDDPPDLCLAEDDIVFVDFGPVFDSWEADIGRTYVLGADPEKLRMRDAVESAWHAGRDYFRANRDTVTAAEMHALAVEAARSHGYDYGNWHAGHLIGNFPHEFVQGETVDNYLHPGNHGRLVDPDAQGRGRNWIYEIHFVDRDRGFGGFFEQWLELD